MLARLTQWLTNPAARRYVGVTSAFMVVSVTLTVRGVENGWVWLLLIAAWVVADTVFVVGTGLTHWQRLLMFLGLLMFDVVLIVMLAT